MAFSDLELHRIKKIMGELCTKRTPEHLKDQLRYEYEIQKHNIVILEVRPVWNNPSEYLKLPMAKLLFVKSQNIWKLYWKRASGKWEKYEPRPFDKELDVLVKEIDKDVYGCFFG
jgi:hypothetical protein